MWLYRINIMVVVVVFALSFAFVESKTFMRCQLVQELIRQHFDPAQLRDWVCLIEAESSRRTHVVGKTNKNGSKDYGLFQINDKYWCSKGTKPGKECNVLCKDLITDNITKAAKCAQQIYKRHNFKAWHGWVKNCEGKPLPVIISCM